MKLEPRKCLKCSAYIQDEAGRPRPNYNEVVFELSDNSQCRVGICAGCSVEKAEWPALVSELKKYGANADVIKLMKERLGFVDVLKEISGNKCSTCHSEIKSTWVVTHGELRHEGC